jgi:hypothetical protein
LYLQRQTLFCLFTVTGNCLKKKGFWKIMAVHLVQNKIITSFAVKLPISINRITKS